MGSLDWCYCHGNLATGPAIGTCSTSGNELGSRDLAWTGSLLPRLCSVGLHPTLLRLDTSEQPHIEFPTRHFHCQHCWDCHFGDFLGLATLATWGWWWSRWGRLGWVSSSTGCARWVLRMFDHDKYLGTGNDGTEEETCIYLWWHKHQCCTRFSGRDHGKLGLVKGSVGGCVFLDYIPSMVPDSFHCSLVVSVRLDLQHEVTTLYDICLAHGHSRKIIDWLIKETTSYSPQCGYGKELSYTVHS